LKSITFLAMSRSRLWLLAISSFRPSSSLVVSSRLCSSSTSGFSLGPIAYLLLV
jgi:hypothetical protein